MKLFLSNIAVIFFTILSMLGTTLLLDLDFIKREFSRELLVYFIMLIEFFVGIRIILLINRN